MDQQIQSLQSVGSGKPARDEARHFESCPQCGGKDFARPFPQELPAVARCTGCGLLFANPQPSDAELDHIYSEHYYEQFGLLEKSAAAKAGLSATKQATYGLMLRLAEKYAKAQNGVRRLLDVGCGLGFSLLAAAKRGWITRGLDPTSPKAAPNLHEHSKDIIEGTLDDYKPAEPYDLVSLIDVIEHVRNPVETVKTAARLLAKGGILLLATGNSASLKARLMGPRWMHFIPAHLWFFTPVTLARVVRDAGLKVETVRTAWRVYNLDYVASVLAAGENFPLAQKVCRWILRWIPLPIRLLPWPPLPEGMVLVATRK